jgi:thioester reductase-like protein
VIASANNQLMDMLVKPVNMDIDKIQQTERNVYKHQPVTLVTSLLVSEILEAATTADNALLHSSQDQTEQSAIDQDQLAHAHKDTHQMDTHASNADQEKSLITTDNNATQHQFAQDQDKFLELPLTATDATLAHLTWSQMLKEEHVLDQSQFAVALKDTQLMDINALNVDQE